MADTPALPRFGLARCWKNVASIQRLLAQYTGEVLDAHTARRVATSVTNLHTSPPPYAHVYDSVAQYIGVTFTKRLLERLSYQLGVRSQALYRGPLLRTESPDGLGWQLVELYKMVPTTKVDRDGFETELFIRAGEMAGFRLSQWFSHGQLTYAAYKALGFGKQRVFGDDVQPDWLVGLWGWVLITEESERLNVGEWEKDPTTTKHNNLILNLRTRHIVDTSRMTDERAAKYSCHRGFDHYCHECPLTVAACEASHIRDPNGSPTTTTAVPGPG